MRFAFGDCVLDPDRRQLQRGAAVVHLSPKAYALLLVLLEHRPKALAKDELYQALWPGLFVSDGSLTNIVTQLRDALGDSGREGGLVRTVHGFGYAFDGEVRVLDAGVAAAGLTCVLRQGEREIVLHRGEHVLGRSPQAEVWIHDDQVSRRHALVVVGDAEAVLEDLRSRNGTFHRGVRVDRPISLADGDEIRIGSATLTVRLTAAGSTVTTCDSERGASRAETPR